jgi:flavin reductase (DIM6/NTAB) family NADH-FMN oxidoreductase RutF
VYGCFLAIVPPARVPKALKQRLRVVVNVPMDEVDVAAQCLAQQHEDAPSRAVRRQ